ncbi:hypothetical protein HDK77DRAFT_265650 [Phyllosticta capitalensis]|uniref:Uncharacterized protein n=1 Tax=Phyllosticta capitalensis TaxID=121624 RepID=A0ABR1YK82_9PEZI
MARPRRRCSQDPRNPYFHRTLVSSVRSRRRDATREHRAACHASGPHPSIPLTLTTDTRQFQVGINVHSLPFSRRAACGRPRKAVHEEAGFLKPQPTNLLQQGSWVNKDPSTTFFPKWLQRLLARKAGKAPLAAQNEISQLLALTNPSHPESLAVYPAGIGGEVPYDFENPPEGTPTLPPAYPNHPFGEPDDSLPMLGGNLHELTSNEPCRNYTTFFHPRCGRLLLGLDEIGQRDAHGRRLHLSHYFPVDRADDPWMDPFLRPVHFGSPLTSSEPSPEASSCPSECWSDETACSPPTGKTLDVPKTPKDPLSNIDVRQTIQAYSLFTRMASRLGLRREPAASTPNPSAEPFPAFDPNFRTPARNHPDLVYPMPPAPRFSRRNNSVPA